jgi:NitT/TauT family transport system ATP-binding protein
MVSHDIEEVVTMADRIVVLGSKPGRIRTIVESSLPRPRDVRSPAFVRLVDKIHDIITGSELPDVSPPPGPRFEPLPRASASDIVHLIEYLDARAGRDDVFRIANDTQREFGELIAAVQAAELLGFVDTPRRMAVLELLGQRFARADEPTRKQLWREQLLGLALFARVGQAIARSPTHRIGADLVVDMIVLALPQEHYERTFDVFISWARYGDLFAYDETARTLEAQ